MGGDVMMKLVGEFADALAEQIHGVQGGGVSVVCSADEGFVRVVFDCAALHMALYDAAVLHASVPDGKIYLLSENNSVPVVEASVSCDFSHDVNLTDLFARITNKFSRMTGVTLDGAAVVKAMPSLGLSYA